MTSWYSNQSITCAGDIQNRRVSRFSLSSSNSTTHSGSCAFRSMSVVSRRDASCVSSWWVLNFRIAFVRSQSLINVVRNFAFNSFLWVPIDRFPCSVKNWISLRMSLEIVRYIGAYFPVLGCNGWLCVLLRVVRVIWRVFLGQLTLACHSHPWRFDLQLWWLWMSTCFFGS